MPFVKVVKNRSYFKRFQVKYRRRREGKTDYKQRQALVTQDKNKYMQPKYRFVVRLTNRFVICQIIYSEIIGDKVVAQAHSRELPKYGLKVGLKNYPAAYCTGLLLARRVLEKFGLGEVYAGNEEVDGNVVKTEKNGREYFVAELDDEKRPFRAFLDVGIRSTTTGNRLFGALKGAVDGGLDIPHNEKRFPGYNRDLSKYDADVHKEHIMGEHIMEYQSLLQDEDEEQYKILFKSYIAEGIEPEDYPELLEKVHAAIRENPSFEKSEYKAPSEWKKWARATKITYEERKARLAEKKEMLGM